MVVTDHAFVDTDHEERVAAALGAELSVYRCAEPAETTEAVRGAAAVLVNFAPIGAEQLAVMAPAATVVRYGVGVDNVDLAAAARAGVAVANVPDYGVATVADHAASLLLALLRRIPLWDAGIRREGWVRPGAAGAVPAFDRTTVGLLGAGRIACSLADRLAPFGFRVLAHDPFAEAEQVRRHGIELADLDAVLSQADALSLHLPATPATVGMIDADLLARLRPGCVLVNTSRGALVDETAVAAALAAGQLGGAGLDVFNPEPIAADSPLRDQANVLLTPHAAFYSESSLQALQRLAAEEAGRALRGEPLRCPVPLPALTDPAELQETR